MAELAEASKSRHHGHSPKRRNRSPRGVRWSSLGSFGLPRVSVETTFPQSASSNTAKGSSGHTGRLMDITQMDSDIAAAGGRNYRVEV